MPGPSNGKRKRKSHGGNKENGGSFKGRSSLGKSHRPRTPSTPSPESLNTPSPLCFKATKNAAQMKPNDEGFVPCVVESQVVENVLFQQPFIYDPGNGPRVRGARAFMSSFFAQPPALDDPLCAEFAREEVLQMLCTVLPEETALILWYNKSRASSRVCPACQRLYRVGDALQDHAGDQTTKQKPISLQRLREQEISGLCSPVCFILASFNYPGAIKSAWGRMGDEMDDETWNLLNGPGGGAAQGEVGHALSMLVRMTRLHDLGLAQLCFDAEEAELLEDAERRLEALVLL